MNFSTISDKNIDQIKPVTSALLSWYHKNARKLPWRESLDPYRIWVSEIMLQQTRVETVIPYYIRFLKAFPTVEALAGADEEKLMKHWQGLGYYSRARNMRKAAKVVAEEMNGRLPQDVEGLKKLPGIGEYTAGAIASIAYGAVVPAVDGNVYRVLSRLLASHEDIGLAETQKALYKVAGKLVPQKESGAYNQAVMDLGAEICVPKTPKCLLCPLTRWCQGYGQGIADQLPVKAVAQKRKQEERTVFFIHCGGLILLNKRPDKGLLAGMWEYPNIPGIFTNDAAEKYWTGQGLAVQSMKALPKAKHIFTHMEWRMQGFWIEAGNTDVFPGGRWVSLDELRENYAIPSAFKAYTAVLERLV